MIQINCTSLLSFHPVMFIFLTRWVLRPRYLRTNQVLYSSFYDKQDYSLLDNFQYITSATSSYDLNQDDEWKPRWMPEDHSSVQYLFLNSK